MRWTVKQNQVIDTGNKNMLVSAAAGSGKTAVLVERIRKLIIEGGADVSEFLIVTFTRAAAAEMKEKIIKAINKAAEEDPEKAGFLRKQLENISHAQISTYDSFARDVVKKYFYVIGVDPGLRIADDQESMILKAEAMDRLFAQLYEEADPGVMRFMDAYQSPKSDAAMKADLTALYDKLRKMPEGIGWLEEAIQRDPEELKTLAFRKAEADADAAVRYFNRTAEVLSEGDHKDAYAKALTDIGGAEAVAAAGSGIAKAAAEFKAVTMSYSKAEKDMPDHDDIKARVNKLRGAGKELIKGIASSLADIDERVEEVRKTLPYQETILGLLRRYEEIYTEMKLDKGVMDFDDSSHYALEILEDEDVAGEYREKFKYIFIDEYQDSNYLQEALIARIKRDDNLFMVGDIKQSIYGFRHAEPDIFKKRGEAYASEDDENSVKIDLNMNFRSKTGVIDTVNEIFRGIMDGYDEDAELVKGVSYSGPLEYQTELHIIDMKKDDEDAGEEDEKAEKQRIEIEADLVAQLVEENLGKEVFDTETGAARPLEKRDIVILLRAAKNKAEKYYEALMDRGIDAYVTDDAGYYETVEIRTVIDMLKITDNRYRDIPLMSVLKSGLFDISNEDLIEVRLASPEGMFSEAFFGYPENGSANDEELKRKIAQFAEELDRWADTAAYTPVDEFIWRMMEETGYYALAGSLPAGRQRMANLRSLVDKAAVFRGRSSGTVREFIGYVDMIDEKQLGAGQKSLKGENEDIVRIMTIHKSKGLEFPVVIVPDLAGRRQGNKDSSSTCGILHKDVGFALPFADREKGYKRETLAMDMVKMRQADDELAESMRVLYVACTRARDKLILVGSVRDWQQQIGAYGNGMVMTGSYLDMIMTSGDLDTVKTVMHKADDGFESGAGAKRRSSRKARIDGLFGSAGESAEMTAEGKEIERRLGYEYPYPESLDRKSKYSVSELNREKHEAAFDPEDAYDLDSSMKKRKLRIPEHITGKDGETGGGMDGMRYGTVMHAVMEQIDFAEVFAADEAGRRALIEEKVKWMHETGLLEDIEADAVDTGQIAAFFDTDIGRRASTTDRLFKEKHFTIKHVLAGDPDEEPVLVQGIIDCFFEETYEREDGSSAQRIVLVDYKTNSNIEGIEELYAEQMALYSEAIEKATGKPVDECYLYLFKIGEALPVSI